MEILNLLPQGLNLFLICLSPLFQPALFFTSSYALIRLHKSGFRLNSYKESHSILNNAGATDTVCLLEVDCFTTLLILYLTDIFIF